MRTALPPILLACLLIVTGCTDVSARAPIQAGSGNSEAPTPPKEFKSFDTRPLAAATDALRVLLTNPTDRQARVKLAEAYSTAGFAGAALFFEDTLLEMENKGLAFAPPGNAIAWAATKRDVSAQVIQVAGEIEGLAAHGDYDGALAKAVSDIEENGKSLQVAVEWANVVVLMAMADPTLVRPERLEPALRLLLTSLFEKIPRPLAVDSTATGFETLSNLFLSLGDKHSATTAARLALHAVRDPAEPYAGDASWRDVAAKRLEERIHQLTASAPGR